MEKLADEYRNSEVGFDVTDDDERFVYSWLEKNKEFLSPVAKGVLRQATVVLDKTFSVRDVYSEDYIDKCFNTWDAGWVQIRDLAKLSNKKELLKGFDNEYKKLENKMNSVIYKYGFLPHN